MELVLILSAVMFCLSLVVMVLPVSLRNWAKYEHISDYSHSPKYRKRILSSYIISGISQIFFILSVYTIASGSLTGNELLAIQIGLVLTTLGCIGIILLTVIDFHKYERMHNLVAKSHVASSVSGAGIFSLGIVSMSMLPALVLATVFASAMYSYYRFTQQDNNKKIYVIEMHHLLVAPVWTILVALSVAGILAS